MSVGPIYFAQPGWLVAVWIWLALWLGVGLLERRGSDVLDRLVSPLLQAGLVTRPARWRRWTRYGLLGVAGLALALATMRPQMGEHFVATPRAGAEIMIALDVSRSMLADDAPPSRLERAKAEVRDLLGYLRDDSVGLIAFAGRASLLSPMTPDLSFLRLALDDAGPHSVPRGGTRIGEAIRRAVVGFGEPGPAQRALILITDGEDHDEFALDAAKMAAEAGIKIIAIGFGDERGSPIFVTDPRTGAREQVRDADGRPVISKLNGELLRAIALETDGAFVPAGTGVLDLASIYAAHVAPLTRGEIDDRGRTLRNEAYQLFLLVAFLCLIAAVRVTAGVFAQAGGSGRREDRARLGAALLGAALLVAGAAPPATAQADAVPASAPASAAASSLAAAGESSADPDSAGAEAAAGEAAGEAAAAEAAERAREVAPRERFNEANRVLREGDAAEAATLLREVRRDATDDPELRQAATWNLGVAAAARAEALVDGDPQAALEALHEAADWLREAVALRPDDEDPRHDLEVVLRRALVLADEIAQAERGKIEDALDALIEQQRTRSLTCAGILEAVSVPEEQAAVERMRSAFDAEATAQRGLLADADELAERVVHERDAILHMSPETRAPEESLRAAQLEGVLVHLDAAIERMGQTRRQLRQRRAERAYRRSSAALGDLKRARDQLRDPVEQIGVLLEEVIGLGRATAALQLRDLPPTASGASPPLPAFLTPESLEEEARRTEQRTTELGARLEQAAEQTAAQAAAGAAPGSVSDGGDAAGAGADPAARALADALVAAAPLVVEAAQGLDRAAAAVGGARWTTALEEESGAAQRLADAREHFLDFDRLLALTLADQTRVAAGSAPEDPGDRAERAPMLQALQQQNLERSQRLARQLETRREETLAQLRAAAAAAPGGAGAAGSPVDPAPAEDPVAREEERFTVAGQLLALAEGAMHESADALDASGEPDAAGEAEVAPDWPEVAAAAERARAHLEALQSLFFSLVEHLQALARDQQDLNDETARAIALAAAEHADAREPLDGEAEADARGPQTRARAARLSAEQEELERRGGAIADALLEQAESAPAGGAPEAAGPGGAADPAAPPGASGAPDPATLRQAAEHVAKAQLSMREARDVLADDARPVEPGAEPQALALESLRAALELLAPPPPPQGEQEQDPQQGGGEQQQSGAGEEDSSSADSDSGAGEPEATPLSAPEEGAGAPEEAEAAPASDDASQLLQGVRDREAQRRRDLERERARSRSRPVEKDW